MQDHIGELAAKFRNGEFGQTRLARPSVLAGVSRPEPLHASDGGLRLADGKHCVAALRALQGEAQKAQTPPTWFQGELRDVLETGLRVDLVTFGDDVDAAAVSLFYVNAHESDNNKLRTHSVLSKVTLVKQPLAFTFRASSVGASPSCLLRKLRFMNRASTAVEAELLMCDVLGSHRRSTIHGWVKAAQTLAPSTLSLLASRPDLPQSYVFVNRYLIGMGEEARFLAVRQSEALFCSRGRVLVIRGYLLKSEYADSALAQLFDVLDLKSKSVNTKEFISEFCVPQYRAQTWEKATRSKYAKVISRCPAFPRCLEMLKGERGRQKILPPDSMCVCESLI